MLPSRTNNISLPIYLFLKKYRYTSAYPRVFYIKVEYKGLFISRTCFPDVGA